MKKFNSGFSLLEIIIAVAILSILASLAIPQYGVYTKRAKVSEAVQLAQEVQLSMVQLYLNKRRFPVNSSSLTARNAEVGYGDLSAYTTDVVSRMWVGSNGVRGSANTSGHIAITLNPDLEAGINGRSSAMLLSTIEFVNGNFEFICGNTGSVWRTTVDPLYLPKSCQN